MMRIAIVNDLPLSVEALRRVVTSVPGYAVAWTAADGAIAVEKTAADKPDLILMDLVMPIMDGAEATRRIMQQNPCAILVVTATVEGHASKVFDAMGWGALDAADTPRLGPQGNLQGAEHLLQKIATIAQLIGCGAATGFTAPIRLPALEPTEAHPLVVLGASTGGPAALATLLAGLPPVLEASVVIVQHVDALFAPGLADWLGTQSARRVSILVPGQKPKRDEILLACTNDHLRMTERQELVYSAEPVEYSFRPSVDVLMRDAAKHWPGPLIGVLLTGMGADGAEGLLAMRRAGAHTIAQDEATSVVYGMPKAAAKLKAAREILPIEQIAGAIQVALRSFAEQLPA